MGSLEVAWGISLVATGWFLAIGSIRMLAYRSGEVDHTPGMRFVAVLSLALGALSLAALIILTIVIARR